MLTTGLLVLRIVLGLTVAAHGAQKLFGWFGGPGFAGFSGTLDRLGIRPARPWAAVAAVVEFGGGLLLALGLLTPVAGLLVAAGMLVAILTVHASRGFWNANSGYEFPLVVMAASVAVSLTGPGAVSLDYLLGVRLPEPTTWVVTAVLVAAGSLAAVVVSRMASAKQRQAPAG
jgi:putative oxidoreductase